MHKRKHGLTGTDDHIQVEGKTKHDIIKSINTNTSKQASGSFTSTGAPSPHHKLLSRRSSFMDLAAHGDVNSDDEDNEGEVWLSVGYMLFQHFYYVLL